MTVNKFTFERYCNSNFLHGNKVIKHLAMFSPRVEGEEADLWELTQKAVEYKF